MVLLEHLALRRMGGGKKMIEKKTMTEEDVMCERCDGRGFMPTKQMTLVDWGFEFH